MSSYSTDKDGITQLRDEYGKLLFDRATGVSVAGWSTHPTITAKFKTVTESNGKATEHGK